MRRAVAILCLLAGCGPSAPERIEIALSGVDVSEQYVVDSNDVIWRRARGAVFPVWSAWRQHPITPEQRTALDDAINALGPPACQPNQRSSISRVTLRARESWCPPPVNVEQTPPENVEHTPLDPPETAYGRALTLVLKLWRP